jgi:arylsulfatase A-like enzyme
LLALVALLPWPPLATRAAPERPDLVLVLADDMADADWRSLPQTRRLLPAAYPDFFLTQPLCCPSRASILTGQYPHNHGTLTNNRGPAAGWPSFRDREGETLAVALQTGGYRTAWIGKYLNHYPASAGPPPGWDAWFATGNGGYSNYEVADGGRVRRFGSAPADYSTDVYRREALEFVRTTPRRQPLFAVVAPTAPHGPAKPAERHEGTCERERVPRTPNLNAVPVGKPAYLRGTGRLREGELDAFDQDRQCALKSVDDLTAAVVAALRARGRPFAVVFASDNGYLLGQHRYIGKGVPYEEAVRVGMRAVGPGFPAGTHRGLVGNVDLAPTFAALAGVALPDADGFDLRRNARPAILLESFGGNPAGVEGPARRGGASAQAAPPNPPQDGPSAEAGLPNPPFPPPWRAVRTAAAVYVETEEDGGTFREFYDLRADPHQLRNRAGSDPRVPAYAAALAALRDCQGQACNEVALPAGP